MSRLTIPPTLIGGFGRKRTPRLAARYADEYNVPFHPLDGFRECVDAAREACEKEERDPDSLRLSAALVLCCGADEPEFRRRAAAIGQEPDAVRENGAAGTPREVVDRLGEFREAGASRVYLQVLDLGDLDHLRLVAEEVAPHVS